LSIIFDLFSGHYITDSGDTIYVALNDNLSVKAFPAPTTASWPSGTPEWSTSGDEWFSSRVSGVGEEKSVDTSKMEDGFEIIATCGSSEKRITVAIFECKFIAYADAPLGGGPVGITGILNKSLTVGHAFWELRVSDFALSYLKGSELSTYGNYVNRRYGFYPAFSDFFVTQSGNGVLGNDDSHSYDSSKEYEISYENLKNGLAATKALASSPGTYTLGTRIKVTDLTTGAILVDFSSGADRNCATVCRSIASQSGVSLPSAQIANWTKDADNLRLLYSGNCPYILNQNL